MIQNLRYSLRAAMAGLVLALALPIMAQSPTPFTGYNILITGLDSINGYYAAVQGSWYTNICAAQLKGDLVRAESITGSVLACDSIKTDVRGKIAIVERGTCPFSQKAGNVFKAGGAGVIVINNAATAIFSMAETAGFGYPANYPSVMISQADGNKLKKFLALGAATTAKVEPVTGDPRREKILWGAGPEGSFSVAPVAATTPNGVAGSWSTFDSLLCSSNSAYPLWRHYPNQNGAIQGQFAAGGGFLNSPTACSGVMGFDSDWYDTDGTATGDGPCVRASQYGELISPVIDLSNVTDSTIAVSFWQATRQNQAIYQIGYKYDNDPWKFEVLNDDIPVNSDHIQGVKRVPFEWKKGAKTIQIKFVYGRGLYYWIVDDVRLIAPELDNTAIQSFIAPPPASAMPVYAIRPFGFVADIKNIGGAAQNDVKLTVNVINKANNSVVFTDAVNYGTVQPNVTVQNRVFTKLFTPPATAANYTIEYRLTQRKADFDTLDNIVKYDFRVTDSLFQTDFGANQAYRPSNTAWAAGERRSWGAGNFIYTGDNDVVPVDARFSISSVAGDANRKLYLNIFEINQDPASTLTELTTITSDERLLKFFGEFTIPGVLANTAEQKIALDPVFDDETVLKRNSTYLLMIQFEGDGVNTDVVSPFIGFNDITNFSATQFLTQPDNAATPNIIEGGSQGPIRFQSAYFADQEQEVNWTTSVFNESQPQYTPAVRLWAYKSPTISTKNRLNGNVEVFPNPTDNLINVNVALNDFASEMQVSLIDLRGQIVANQKFTNTQNQLVQFETNQLASGTYMVRIQTNSGVQVNRIVVQH